jgi:hypothetical protein
MIIMAAASISLKNRYGEELDCIADDCSEIRMILVVVLLREKSRQSNYQND